MKLFFCLQHITLIIVFGEYIFQVWLKYVCLVHWLLSNSSFEVQLFPQSTITIRFWVMYSWANMIKILSLKGRAGNCNHLSAKSCSTEIIRLIGTSNVSNERLIYWLHIWPGIQYTLNIVMGDICNSESLYDYSLCPIGGAKRISAVGIRNHQTVLLKQTVVET